jgi:hypothetical protein
LGNIFEFSGQDEEEEEEEEDVLDGDDAVIQDNERSKNTALTDETHYDNSFFEEDNQISVPVDMSLPRSFLKMSSTSRGNNTIDTLQTLQDNVHDDDFSIDTKQQGLVTSSTTLSSFPNPPLISVSTTLRTAMAAAFADISNEENDMMIHTNGTINSPRSLTGITTDAASSAAISAVARFRNPNNGIGFSSLPINHSLDANNSVANNSVASSSVLLGGLQMGASTARSLFANSSTNSVNGGGRSGGYNSNTRSLHVYKTALHGLRNSLKRNTNSFAGTTSFLLKGPTAIQRARQRPLIGYLGHGSSNIEFEGEGERERGGRLSSREDRDEVSSSTSDVFNLRTELPLSLKQSYSRGQIGIDYVDSVNFSGQVNNNNISSISQRSRQSQSSRERIDEVRLGTASSIHEGGPRSLPAFRGVLRQAAEAQASYTALEALLQAVEEGGGTRSEQSTTKGLDTRLKQGKEQTTSHSSTRATTSDQQLFSPMKGLESNNSTNQGNNISSLLGKAARAAYA